MQITDYPSFLNIRPGMPLTALVSAIFNSLLMIGGLAAMIMLIVGGVKYLTSAGNASLIRDAKKQIFASILGLIILFSSWMILNVINPELVNIKEPGAVPPPIIQASEAPAASPAETSALFYYIPLGQIIDDVVAQERETLPKIRQFADSATECKRDLCEGGECEYWIKEPCPEETPPPTPPEEETPWWEFWRITPPITNAQEDCGRQETCSASCDTGDPCSADKNDAIDKVLAAANQMEKEIAILQQGKEKIRGCVLQEDTTLLSCQEVLDTFGPDKEGGTIDQWNDVKNCRQGYDFYCLYGSDEDVYLDEIILPFEGIKESIESVKELEKIVSSCRCSNCSFSCGECSGNCKGTPCPDKTYSALSSAVESVNKLETQSNKLEETVAEIAGLSAADEIITLTCSEAYSWLKSIKESGCPGTRVFPCCPIDQETEKTIRNCRGTDFFFCSTP